MINRYALIENGSVINVILWDGGTETWQPPQGMTTTLLPDGSPVSPGYTFDGANFHSPSP
ncbi:hypothetical protein BLA17378_04484 [Burkholderia aenigmatica]|uniref:Phage tail protein n=1 Tax=Burkholderia aenigmatica TaxID=2015348 RepID=A0ABY6XVH3_9BURK|nr:hypothetical protein BLA17378_04484 [Burkholderia aenigmatica]